MLVTYSAADWGGLDPMPPASVIGGVFILPFLLFSATTGQLADKYDKAALIRFVKNLEIAIMLAIARWASSGKIVALLFAGVFLMGLHSTLFGPVKYAYLPQHLHERELTGGNGMVEMGTFVAILLGNVVGGVLIGVARRRGPTGVGGIALALAVVGRVAAAQFVPASPATDPGLTINWNPVTETWRNLGLAHSNLVGVPLAAGHLLDVVLRRGLPDHLSGFAKDVLDGDEHVASLLLVVFSIGIGIGSLLCEMLSRPQSRSAWCRSARSA